MEVPNVPARLLHQTIINLVRIYLIYNVKYDSLVKAKKYIFANITKTIYIFFFSKKQLMEVVMEWNLFKGTPLQLFRLYSCWNKQ